jgi:hypothetical protein
MLPVLLVRKVVGAFQEVLLENNLARVSRAPDGKRTAVAGFQSIACIGSTAASDTGNRNIPAACIGYAVCAIPEDDAITSAVTATTAGAG